MIRLDGPAGPYTPPPAWATPELRAEAIRIATTRAHIDGPEVNGRARSFVFDEQIDTRVVRWPPQAQECPRQRRRHHWAGRISPKGNIATTQQFHRHGSDPLDSPLGFEHDGPGAHPFE
ncbi:replication initiator [Streptomyces sp. NPDC059752]|uniref:replication initiator n=1 Tax=unclassified Streptomyces TaxID=2593676 RepID=UPI00366973B6